MRKIFLLLLTVCFAAMVNGQSSANYSFSTNNNGSLGLDINSNTVDMSTGTTQIVGAGLDASSGIGVTNIGFDFFFMGTRFNQFSVQEDGIVQLGSATVSTNTYTINGGTLAAPRLAAFNADFRTGTTSGKIHYKLVGTAPNRVLVIEFVNMQLFYTSTGTAGTSTWQVRLYESTGTIEYVYGAMSATDVTTGNRSPSIGFYTGSATNSFASVTYATHTSSVTTPYAANPAIGATGTITDLNSAADPNRRFYKYVPPVPADATGLSFTGVAGSAMTLNWTDNATNELGYVLYRSTDGINYSFITQLAANIVTYNATGLSFGTNYFWKIYAVTEGGLSGALSGSQLTNTGSLSGTKTVGTGGDYNNLTLAFAAINANGLAGNIDLQLITGYPAVAETYPILSSNASAVGAFNVKVYPTVSGLSITSSNTTGTLLLDNGTNITFDGRVNAAGSTKDLIIENTATAGYTIRFANDAIGNIIKYCSIKGVNTSTTSGTIVFSTTTGANGNDNNVIDNNDIRDGATTPANGIYSSGTTTTATQNNSGNVISGNNIFNFFAAGSADNGILISSGNTDWTILGNSLYQTATRTYTASGNHIGINISNSSGNNFNVTNNFIGGGAPGATGTAWTFAGVFTNRFRAISLSVGSTTASSVQGNIITNFVHTSNSSATTAGGPWVGIYLTAGNANIGTTTTNTIGSGTGTGAINLTVVTNSGARSSGIYCDATSTVSNISNNIIGAITSGASTISQGFSGIVTTAGTTLTINNNTIGSTSTANSINMNTGATSTTAQVVYGINNSSSATISITNNTIANINNNYLPSAANTSNVVAGILSSSGINSITGNTVRNLSTAANATGTSSSASVIGIALTSTTTGVTNVSQNSVYALSNTHATAATAITGIHYAGPTTLANVVARNLVYNLGLSTNSTTADIRGISFTSGLATIQNNMIRLGYNETGTAIANGIPVTGLYEVGSTASSAIYFNSVYVGGTGVGTQTGNTYAFRTDQTTNVRTFQDNIFVNGRSNATTGGKHYAVRAAGTAPNPAGLALNYNDYQVTGTGGVFGFFNSLDVANIAAWRTATGQDANSLSGNPQFIDPTGTTPDLHIHPTNPTEIEGAGLAVGAVTDDYDGQARASFTPTDLGADAGNFVSADLTAPVITYTAIPATACLTDRTLSATITDLSGVNSTAGTKPRLYFKKSGDANTYAGNTNADNGWKYVEASNASSPFSFTTDYTLLQSAVLPGDVIQYFVVAQDIAAIPNVGINSGTFAVAPTSVALTAGAFPLGGTINSYAISSTVPTSITIGAAGNYTTLTAAGTGFFADLNAKSLSGNTTVVILDAAIPETGAVALNQINYGCSGGPFTLTIKPNAGVTTVLSGSNATALIDLNGADNVIFDGSNNGSNSKDMTISNTNTSGATIRFINDATTNTVMNTILLGANSSSTSGTVVFSTTTGSSGNSSNTISNCDIRDGATAPANAVYSSGSAGGPNASNTVTGNNIFNWTTAGVSLTATGNGNSWTINSNNFYQTALRTTQLTAISDLSAANAHTINNNSIGGSNATRGGTAMTTSSSSGLFGITLNAGTVTTSNIQGNLIGNISSTSTSPNNSMINITGGNVNVGTTAGNIIGEATANSISSANTIVGIAYSGSGLVDIRNNTIRNLTYNDADFERLAGIYVTGGTATIKDNTIRDFSHSGSTTSSAGTAFAAFGIGIATSTAGNLVENNQIFNFNLAFNGASNTSTYPMYGILVNSVSSTGTATNISKNRIYNFTTTRTGTTTSAPVISGIYAFSGAATYSNNMVSLTQATASTQPLFRGILLESTGNNNFFFNSVFVGGTPAAANNTYGFYRISTSGTQSILNNIFDNERAGIGNHFAIGTSSTTGWLAGFSNYNDLYSINPSTVGDWGGTAQTLTGWKAAQAAGSGGDANSFSELPAFVSPINLHIPPATATQIESGGIAAGGITTDIDNETRPGPTNVNGGGTSVDVGADEFDGTPASVMTFVSSTTTQSNTSNVNKPSTNQEVIGIQIVTTGTLSPLSATSFTLNTNGTTALADISNAKLWYTGTSSTFATSTQFGSTVAAPSGSYSITGTQALSSGTNYFWLTYDVPCTATATDVIDAECNSLTVSSAQTPTVQAPAGSRTIVVAGLSGVVTIGAAGTYPSLTGTGGLFAAINAGTLSGALTANIIDASVTETGANALNAINYGCSGPYTLTIKPNTTAVLTGSVSTGAIIKLNGADNVIIDGSNSGGTDRSLTIQNTTTTTAGNAVIWLASPAIGNGATNNIIKNTVIEGNASTTTFMGMYVGGSSTITLTAAGAELNSNNTITNNLFRKTQYGLAMFGWAAASPDLNNVVSNNNFGTGVTGEGFNLEALHADRQQNLVVSGNEVQNVKGISTTNMYGIRLLDFKNGLAYNNKIHDISYTGTSTTKVYGLAVQSATYTTAGNPSQAQIYNNSISTINSTGTSAVWNVTGMLASSGYGDKFYYNSVSLTGAIANSSSGLSAAFANGDGNITTAGTNIDVTNNVFSLTGSTAATGGNFWAFYTSATSFTGSVSNYNDLYCNGTGATNNVGRFNSTSYATLGAWQGATSQDANSISADALFNGVNNLQPQVGSPLVAAAIPVGGITTDITGFTRSVTTPTIGAYEQAADGAAPVITYTALGATCVAGDRALNGVIITDATGVPTSGALQPRIYYKKGVGGAWFSSQGSLASGSGTNGTWNFTIIAADMGGLAAADVVYYYVIAQDLVGNVSSNPAAGLVATNVNTVTTAPTAPNSYVIGGTLNGTYTVGAGGNYTTLTAAVAAYNASCLGGPVVFSLTDASYSGSETFPISINLNPAASSTNTLTISPAAGIAATITGTSGASASALIRLNGAKYITFDGINSGGASLTVENTSTTAGTTAFWLSSNGVGLGATNNTIRNTNIKAGVSQNAATTNTYGVVIAGSALSGTHGSITAGDDNDNNTITLNTFTKVRYGIFTRGGSTTNANTGTVISNNIIGPSSFGADEIGKGGVTVREEDGIQITGNHIRFIGGDFANTSSGTDRAGIELGTDVAWSASSAPTSVYVKNAVITNNTIHDIVDERTFSALGIVVSAADGTNATNNLVANNMIYGIKANGTLGDQAVGIALSASNTDKVVFNSIYLTGDTDPDAGASTPTQSNFGVSVGFTAVTNPLIADNIVYMDLSSSSDNTIKNSCINVPATYVWGTGLSNYNDFYVLPANTESYVGTVGGIGGTFHLALGAWQTAVTQDANSLSIQPVFVSGTNLHLVPGSNCALHRKGTPIAGVTTDIDNDTRHVTYPDMGADEFVVNVTGTVTWTGAVNTDWFNPGNWNCGELPGPTSNVVINGSLPNYPVVTANVTIFSIVMNPGSTMTVATGVVFTLLGP